MKALIPLENLGIYIIFFKSASCETEENRLRFAEYSRFYFNLCLFPAITREGPKMQRFHLNYYALHFSREGFSLLAQTCCRRSPTHRAPTRNRASKHRAGGRREYLCPLSLSRPSFSNTRRKQRGKNRQN